MVVIIFVLPVVLQVAPWFGRLIRLIEALANLAAVLTDLLGIWLQIRMSWPG